VSALFVGLLLLAALLYIRDLQNRYLIAHSSELTWRERVLQENARSLSLESKYNRLLGEKTELQFRLAETSGLLANAKNEIGVLRERLKKAHR
jgi:hypothetical protein